jgi:FG-GAP-like repeat
MRNAMLFAGLLMGICPFPAFAAEPDDATNVRWKKTVIDKRFVSEGVAVADVNKDGKMDILTGEFWYEAPNWTPHRFRPGKDDYTNGDNNVYSACFCCWAEDVNGDGWPDLIIVGMPGEPCHWYENPQGKEGMWKEHFIWDSACNETPQFADLFGTGKRVLVMGFQPNGKNKAGSEGQMAWFAPGKDPTKPWEMHPISEPSVPPEIKDGKPVPKTGKSIPGTDRYSHGLGIGDINGDGRLDVICTAGWWEQPAKVDDQPWKFHKAPLGDACADMHAVDLDGDGKADVVSSSAHNFGIWSYFQKSGQDGEPAFVKKDLFPKLLSQTHALNFVDINGDGLKDLVTGKRKWAHGPKGDADPGAPPCLYWFEAKKSSDGVITFVPHLIDNDSGVGTQFTVADVNRDKLPDIVVANKNGVYLFEQVRGK